MKKVQNLLIKMQSEEKRKQFLFVFPSLVEASAANNDDDRGSRVDVGPLVTFQSDLGRGWAAGWPPILPDKILKAHNQHQPSRENATDFIL